MCPQIIHFIEKSKESYQISSTLVSDLNSRPKYDIATLDQKLPDTFQIKKGK
jgi:hypothetical protein